MLTKFTDSYWLTGSAPPYLSELLHLNLQSFPLSPLFVRHTHAQYPTFQPQNLWLSHFLTLWPPHLEHSPPRHQALCYSLFLQKSTQDISLLRIFQLNHIVLHSHQSVQYMCVCVCVRGCVCVCIFCIIILEHLSIYTFLFNLFFWITFSISVYIMCVCLFSALIGRVGALQISIIIVLKKDSLRWSCEICVERKLIREHNTIEENTGDVVCIVIMKRQTAHRTRRKGQNYP